MPGRCTFCGSTMGRSARWRGCSRLLMCADCQAAHGHGAGPYPMMTRAQMRADLELLPTWALEQKAAANRQVIAVMRRRLAAGEEVARMYQEPGLAWLERQAEVAEDLMLRSLDSVGEGVASVACGRRWAAPHPWSGAGIQLAGRHPGGQGDLLWGGK